MNDEERAMLMREAKGGDRDAFARLVEDLCARGAELPEWEEVVRAQPQTDDAGYRKAALEAGFPPEVVDLAMARAGGAGG